MTRESWIDIINERQNMYAAQLATIIQTENLKKIINFNSPTGTGKTVMVSKLVNLLSGNGFFFLITSLSRGSLANQVENSLNRNIKDNSSYKVFGVNSFTKSSKLSDKDIIDLIPTSKKLIWIRDEGHIKSNNWMRILEDKSFKIINISATNSQVDIQCNFTDTPLLRTPIQRYGTPLDAVDKLIEIKRIHRNVPHYNPCLIVRDVNDSVGSEFEKLAELNNLKRDFQNSKILEF